MFNDASPAVRMRAYSKQSSSFFVAQNCVCVLKKQEWSEAFYHNLRVYCAAKGIFHRFTSSLRGGNGCTVRSAHNDGFILCNT